MNITDSENEDIFHDCCLSVSRITFAHLTSFKPRRFGKFFCFFVCQNIPSSENLYRNCSANLFACIVSPSQIARLMHTAGFI